VIMGLSENVSDVVQPGEAYKPVPHPKDGRWNIWTVGCLEDFKSTGLRLGVLRQVLGAQDVALGRTEYLRNKYVGRKLIELVLQRRNEAFSVGSKPSRWDERMLWWEWIPEGDSLQDVNLRLYGDQEKQDARYQQVPNANPGDGKDRRLVNRTSNIPNQILLQDSKVISSVLGKRRYITNDSNVEEPSIKAPQKKCKDFYHTKVSVQSLLISFF
jgi:hypothetical protein